MYKVNTNNEYKLILLFSIGFVFFGILLLSILNYSHNSEIMMERLKYFPLLAILIMIIDMIGIIYEINLINKYKWLSQNGFLVKNLPFTSYVDAIYMSGGARYDTTIFVEYKSKTGEILTLSKNLRGKKHLKKYKTIDILIDKDNPKKRYYIDFDIQKI